MSFSDIKSLSATSYFLFASRVASFLFVTDPPVPSTAAAAALILRSLIREKSAGVRI
jgi:hypothetical protein